MSLILVLPESLSQQSPEKGELIQYEMSLNDPTGQSQGYQQRIYLRPGVSLLIDRHSLNDDLLVERFSGACWTGFEFSFYIAGNFECEGMLPGKTFTRSGFYRQPKGFRRWGVGQQITKFDIQHPFAGL